MVNLVLGWAAVAAGSVGALIVWTKIREYLRERRDTL